MNPNVYPLQNCITFVANFDIFLCLSAFLAVFTVFCIHAWTEYGKMLHV